MQVFRIRAKNAWIDWLADQLHACLLWSVVGLLRVAVDASRHDVGPRSSTTQTLWDDVIEREMLNVELLAAVLAGLVVTRIDVRATESDSMWESLRSVRQSNDGWSWESFSSRTDVPIVTRNNLYLIEKGHAHRSLPSDDLERLITLIQQECSFGTHGKLKLASTEHLASAKLKYTLHDCECNVA